MDKSKPGANKEKKKTVSAKFQQLRAGTGGANGAAATKKQMNNIINNKSAKNKNDEKQQNVLPDQKPAAKGVAG